MSLLRCPRDGRRDVAMRGLGKFDNGKRGVTGLRRRSLSPAFRMAVLAGAVESVRMHLCAGTDLDATDTQGRSPLILAVSRGHLDVCKLLLEAGADPATKDNEGNDAHAVARSRGETAVAELLHSAGESAAEHRDDNNDINRNPADEGPLNGRSLGRTATTFKTTEETAVGAVGGAGERSHVDRGVPRDEWVAEPPAHYNDVFDLSAWQEEVETEAPPDDLSCADEAATLQEAVSRHNPVDTDEIWDDVEIDFPELETLGRRRSPFRTETKTAVRALILEALRNGRVDDDRIRSALAEDDQLEDAKRAEFESNLRLVLGDAGVVIGDEPFTTDTAVEVTDEDEDLFGDVATEAMGFLGRLQSSDADPLAPYMRSLPTDRLTRDDETALGMAMEEGMREVLTAIAGSRVVVSRLLSDARSVMEGNTPARALFETSNAQEDGDKTLSDDTTDGQENDWERGVAPIADTLSTYLQAIVELCQRHKVDRAALAARLFDVGLSAEYREELQRVAEQDSTCEYAAIRIRAGLRKVNQAKQRFVETNHKLVIWVAKKHRGLLLADRIQAGSIGLMRAIDRFDHRRGAKFSTYAVWWIRQRITRTVGDTDRTIRLPVHVTDSLRKVEKARALAYAMDGRDSDVDRITALADLPPDRVRKLLSVPEEPLPMDDPGIVEEVGAIADEGTPSPEAMAMAAQMRMRLKEQLGRLTSREATVLRRRFGIDCGEHTLEEVSKEFGVTRERIRQIEAKALRKLRLRAPTARLRDVLR